MMQVVQNEENHFSSKLKTMKIKKKKSWGLLKQKPTIIVINDSLFRLLKSIIFKLWYLVQQHKLHPKPNESDTASVLTSPPTDLDAHYSLRTTVLNHRGKTSDRVRT